MSSPTPSRAPSSRLASVVLALALLAAAAGVRPVAAQSTLPPASPENVGAALLKQAGLEGRVLWMDGTANLQRLSTAEGVAAVFDHCQRANIPNVVVDVKPLSGHVLYESKVAPKLVEWRGFRYPAGYDLLKVAIEEGHRRGLKVHANINVFSDGHKLVKSGPAFEKGDQQAVIYDVERTVTTPLGMKRTLALGINRGPEIDQVSAYDTAFRGTRAVQPGEVAALVSGDRVEAVYDPATAPINGLATGNDRCLLIGRGEGARWLRANLRPGDQLVWSATERLLPILNAPSETVAAFMNPANPVSREYLLKVVDEIVSNYDIDGIVFDRMRYSSLQSDFSDLSREKFEEFLGQKLSRFPADVFSYETSPCRPLLRGPYFKQWLEWRARNIRTWLENASKIVRTRRPQAKIGVYVGSWYTTYYSVGVNWGSDEFAPGYDWMSPSYNTTGYAGLLDWITTGCYHPVATRAQAKNAGLDDSFTVQAAAELSTRAVGDVAFVYAGIYVKDYNGSPEAFREAIDAARTYSHGVMLFDLVHIEENGWWPILEETFRQPRTAPHDVPALLAAMRAVRKAVNSAARNSLAN